MNIPELVRIEAASYPYHMCQMQHVVTLRDLQEYCESRDVLVHQGPGWYIIGARHRREMEIVDIAGSFGVSIMRELNLFIEASKRTVFILDAREGTSYRLIQTYERRGKITILEDEPWDWGGELMHAMRILCM